MILNAASICAIGLILNTSLAEARQRQELCYFHYLSFDEDHLHCLNKSSVIAGIKPNFQKFEERKKNCPMCTELVPNISLYSYLFSRDYLPLSMGPNDFGGYFVFIVFKNDPQIYELWLYETDEGVFQIRHFDGEEPPKVVKNKMKALWTKKRYAKYWINAFSKP